MYKILTSLLFIFITLSTASEETYVFEAKGEFAKELKFLVEKYSKEGKIDAKVYIKKENDNSIINSIFTKNKIIMNGKKIYDKQCSTCHGEKGKRSPGYGARAMNTMTKEDIEIAIQNYKNDMQYGGSGKMLMQGITITLREVELNSIIAYVHGTSVSNSETSTQVEENSEAPTSYLQ